MRKQKDYTILLIIIIILIAALFSCSKEAPACKSFKTVMEYLSEDMIKIGERTTSQRECASDSFIQVMKKIPDTTYLASCNPTIYHRTYVIIY